MFWTARSQTLQISVHRSKLLSKTLGVEGSSKEGKFPDLAEALNFFDVSSCDSKIYIFVGTIVLYV